MLSKQDDYLIVDIVQNCLGQPKHANQSKNTVQWEFNCPSAKCFRDKGKFNLAYKSNTKVFKCWKCKYSGFVQKLIRDHGSKEDLSRLKLLLPEYSMQPFSVFKRPAVNYDFVSCELPEGYFPLNLERASNFYKLALNYVLNTRKISRTQIDKYKIGYTETGSRKFRIILPSFNSIGILNYFEARSFLENSKIPYLKPDSPDKQDIIFNEQFINWDLPVYLVEGVFDALRLPNAIAMLGKTPSDLLINKLLKNNCTVIICLDSDAIKDGVEIYEKLSSLGLNMFFIDLKGKKDISKIFEDHGQEGIDNLLKTVCRVGVLFKLKKIMNE